MLSILRIGQSENQNKEEGHEIAIGIYLGLGHVNVIFRVIDYFLYQLELVIAGSGEKNLMEIFAEIANGSIMDLSH